LKTCSARCAANTTIVKKWKKWKILEISKLQELVMKTEYRIFEDVYYGDFDDNLQGIRSKTYFKMGVYELAHRLLEALDNERKNLSK